MNYRRSPRCLPKRQTFWTNMLLDSEIRDGWSLCIDPACKVGRSHAHRDISTVTPERNRR